MDPSHLSSCDLGHVGSDMEALIVAMMSTIGVDDSQISAAVQASRLFDACNDEIQNKRAGDMRGGSLRVIEWKLRLQTLVGFLATALTLMYMANPERAYEYQQQAIETFDNDHAGFGMCDSPGKAVWCIAASATHTALANLKMTDNDRTFVLYVNEPTSQSSWLYTQVHTNFLRPFTVGADPNELRRLVDEVETDFKSYTAAQRGVMRGAKWFFTNRVGHAPSMETVSAVSQESYAIFRLMHVLMTDNLPNMMLLTAAGMFAPLVPRSVKILWSSTAATLSRLTLPRQLPDTFEEYIVQKQFPNYGVDYTESAIRLRKNVKPVYAIRAAKDSLWNRHTSAQKALIVYYTLLPQASYWYDEIKSQGLNRVARLDDTAYEMWALDLHAIHSFYDESDERLSEKLDGIVGIILSKYR